MAMATFVSLPYVVHAGQGLDAPLGWLGTVHKVPAHVTEGRAAIVEHTLAPRRLAAPLHRHSREDELSIVLEGEMGALLGSDVVIAGPGAYVLKPRGQWHTFWNAGETRLRFAELIVPAGFEGYFEQLSSLLTGRAGLEPAELVALAAQYGVEFDFESVPVICERFGLIA